MSENNKQVRSCGPCAAPDAQAHPHTVEANGGTSYCICTSLKANRKYRVTNKPTVYNNAHFSQQYVCVCVDVEVVTYILHPGKVEQVAPKHTADDGRECFVQSQTKTRSNASVHKHEEEEEM